jgi:hypothetical protein
MPFCAPAEVADLRRWGEKKKAFSQATEDP